MNNSCSFQFVVVIAVIMMIGVIYENCSDLWWWQMQRVASCRGNMGLGFPFSGLCMYIKISCLVLCEQIFVFLLVMDVLAPAKG